MPGCNSHTPPRGTSIALERKARERRTGASGCLRSDKACLVDIESQKHDQRERRQQKYPTNARRNASAETRGRHDIGGKASNRQTSDHIIVDLEHIPARVRIGLSRATLRLRTSSNLVGSELACRQATLPQHFVDLPA
jgi:hypothetical protein